MDRREHHRVQLRLPARLRWTTPFGQKTEVCTAVDVSRGGMLVPCREPHAEGMSLWVTFPFNASLIVGQPEVLARVVRAMVVVRDGHVVHHEIDAALEAKGVRVCGIAPGAVAVERGQEERRAMETLLGRIGKPEDIADAVVFLAGADFVTGTTLVVDGGYSIS